MTNVCSLCILEGVIAEAIKGWPGIPICRSHIAEIVEKNTASTPPRQPTPGIFCTTVQ